MIEIAWHLLPSATLMLSAPLILAAMGGLLSERSGVLNVALEGKMLGAACIAGIVAGTTGSPFLGLLGGVTAGILLSMIHVILTQFYRIDHIISGMALNGIMLGLTNLLDVRFTNSKHLGDLPSYPTSYYTILAILLPAITYFYLQKTRMGLHILAVGSDPDKSREMGLNPIRVRFGALLITGIYCGLAGAMIISNAGRFTDNMTAGRGFMALAAVILGSWKPVPTAFACLLFGFFEALNYQLQGQAIAGIILPPQFWNSLPYLVTLVALGGLLGKSKVPQGIGKA